MLEKNQIKLAVVRGLTAAFTNELVAKGRKPDERLTDEEALAVINRNAKQRKDSIAQFRAGGREDLAKTEEAELKIIESYLPAPMSKAEIETMVKEVMASTGFQTKDKIGQLTGAVMKEMLGRAGLTSKQADGALVRKVAEKLLE